MPNSDLSEMKSDPRRASPQAASGMLYGAKELADALREMSIAPAAPPAKDPWWKAVTSAWAGPAGVALIAGSIIGGVLELRDANKSIADNAAGVEKLRTDVGAIQRDAKDTADILNRISARMDQTEADIKARRTGVDEWRKSVERQLEPVRDYGFKIGEAKRRADEQEIRTTRILEVRRAFEEKMQETLSRIDARLSVIEHRARQEAGRQGRGPFLESPIWNGLQGPLIQGASSQVPEVLRRRRGSARPPF